MKRFQLGSFDIESSSRDIIRFLLELYFEKEIITSTDQKDKILLSMFNKLDETMKKKVVIYINELLHDKEEINLKYKQITTHGPDF